MLVCYPFSTAGREPIRGIIACLFSKLNNIKHETLRSPKGLLCTAFYYIDLIRGFYDKTWGTTTLESDITYVTDILYIHTIRICYVGALKSHEHPTQVL